MGKQEQGAKWCPCGRMRWVDSETNSGWWHDGMQAFEEGVCSFCHHLLYAGGKVGQLVERVDKMTDFEQAMALAKKHIGENRDTRGMGLLLLEQAVDGMAAAHADAVAERDSYRDVARKLARYVLPDSDTLTFQQLVEIADAVCEAAEDAADAEAGEDASDAE